MAGIAIDDVEAGAPGAERCLAMPAPVVADVLQIHGARLRREIAVDRLMGGPDGRHAAVDVGARRAVVDQFAARERAVLMYGLRHLRKRRDIMVVPQPRFSVRRHVAGGMDLTLLGADHRPASFGLHAAHAR